ncbi:MAG: dihydroorotase [Oceanococcus sp.]
MKSLTITQPDDWHLHLRDGVALADTVAHTARQFARAIVMPNLKPPITSVALADGYRQRILAALPQDLSFQPLMSLYLTDQTTPAMVEAAAKSGFVHGFKLYPAGATTNSDAGVTDLDGIHDCLAAMSDNGLVFQVHGEVTDSDVDIFDREAVFIERILKPIRARHPELKIVLEHITTAQAVEFVLQGGEKTAATITPQHIRFNRNELFRGGLRPHAWCLPILKAEAHRLAVSQAAMLGDPRFFLGTDSAPHRRETKESDCGCAGMFSAPNAIELYADSFEAAGQLDKLEDFASHFGADFYALPRNSGRLVLNQQDQSIPNTYALAGGEVVPMLAGETLSWTAQLA